MLYEIQGLSNISRTRMNHDDLIVMTLCCNCMVDLEEEEFWSQSSIHSTVSATL